MNLNFLKTDSLIKKSVIDEKSVKDLEKTKSELKTCQNKLKVIEEEFDIDFEHAVKLRDISSCIKAELSEAKLVIEDFEKKKVITDRLIKCLQQTNEESKIENSVLKKQMDLENKKLEIIKNDQVHKETKENEMIFEINNLKKEIEELLEINAEKEAKLARIRSENDDLVEMLETLQLGNGKHKTKDEVENSSVKSLEEELVSIGVVSPSIKCKYCEETFPSSNAMKTHTRKFHIDPEKIRLIEMEAKLAVQTKSLVISINRLMKKESLERTNPCNCKSTCWIVHARHNWKRNKSSDLINQLEEMKKGESEVMKTGDVGEVKDIEADDEKLETEVKHQGGMS